MTECDVLVPGIPGTGIFLFFWWYRNRYRNKFVPEKVSEPVSEKFGTGKKVSEPVSEKFDTGTDFRCQNLGILKIYNGYRYRIGTGTENFSFFWWYRNRYRNRLVPEKVSEPVSVKFGIGKKSRNRYRENLVP